MSAQTAWARQLLERPDAEVRSITAEAFRLANDPTLPIPEAGQQARWALNGLPEMSGASEGALASAVLVACAPDRMAVWDRRVKAALCLPTVAVPVRPGKGYYGKYLEAAVSLAERDGGPTPEPRHSTRCRPRVVGPRR